MVGARERAVSAALKWADHRRTCWRQYELTGDPEALEYCVLAARLAVDAVPADHELVAQLRYDLVRALAEAYAAGPTPELLDEALAELPALLVAAAGDTTAHELASRLLRHAKEHDGPPLAHHAVARETYYSAFGEYFLEVGRMLVAAAVQESDLDTAARAVRILDRALVPTDVPPDVRSERLHQHALALAIHWQLGGKPTDLDAAIRELGDAVALVDRVPAELHHDMAEALLHRYGLRGDAEDIHRAVTAHAAVPREWAGDDRWRRRMIRLRWAAYEAAADLADLDAAIELARGLIVGVVEPITGDLRLLRNLLAARRFYRDDSELADQLGELSRVIADDEPDPPFAPWPLGWRRTYG